MSTSLDVVTVRPYPWQLYVHIHAGVKTMNVTANSCSDLYKHNRHPGHIQFLFNVTFQQTLILLLSRSYQSHLAPPRINLAYLLTRNHLALLLSRSLLTRDVPQKPHHANAITLVYKCIQARGEVYSLYDEAEVVI